MRKSLFSKMVATYTIITAITFVIIATFLSLWFQRYYFEQRKNQLNGEAQLLNDYVLQLQSGEIDRDRIDEILNVAGKYSKADIWLVDKYGYVYAASNEGHQNLTVDNQVLTTDIKQLSQGNHVEKIGTTYGKLLSMPVYTYETPTFDSQGVFRGAIILNTSMEQIKAPLKRVYEIIWISAVFAVIIFSIVIYYLSQRIIIKPLAQINSVARKFSKGEVDKRVNISSDDEIGELSKSFNLMADSLEQVEKNRRNFISNVSHELRSPITSIKGFIGGILDGIIPKEKHSYYLSIAYEEIQRLTRLVNDLLDLSALESGQFSMKLGKVDINEIIRITVIKFEQKLKSKRLNVDVLLSGEELYVISDRDRLIQVITNLLDNSIKYVEEGGNIKISSKERGQRAYISVFNDGPIISEGDINHIWDRFYKSDKARSSKVSTGLGLPIVRNILTQLGEDIWVENAPGKGVIFTFTLKKSYL